MTNDTSSDPQSTDDRRKAYLELVYILNYPFSGCNVVRDVSEGLSMKVGYVVGNYVYGDYGDYGDYGNHQRLIGFVDKHGIAYKIVPGEVSTVFGRVEGQVLVGFLS